MKKSALTPGPDGPPTCTHAWPLGHSVLEKQAAVTLAVARMNNKAELRVNLSCICEQERNRELVGRACLEHSETAYVLYTGSDVDVEMQV